MLIIWFLKQLYTFSLFRNIKVKSKICYKVFFLFQDILSKKFHPNKTEIWLWMYHIFILIKIFVLCNEICSKNHQHFYLRDNKISLKWILFYAKKCLMSMIKGKEIIKPKWYFFEQLFFMGLVWNFSMAWLSVCEVHKLFS